MTSPPSAPIGAEKYNPMNDRVPSALGLPAPLRPAPDMPASWQDVDLDFDTAAQRSVQQHQADGVARDLTRYGPSVSGGRQPQGERFLPKPVAGHEPSRLSLRSAAFSMLCTRLGAPAESPARQAAGATSTGHAKLSDEPRGSVQDRPCCACVATR